MIATTELLLELSFALSDAMRQDDSQKIVRNRCKRKRVVKVRFKVKPNRERKDMRNGRTV